MGVSPINSISKSFRAVFFEKLTLCNKLKIITKFLLLGGKGFALYEHLELNQTKLLYPTVLLAFTFFLLMINDHLNCVLKLNIHH